MTIEYTRFGDEILQREEGSTDDWESVPADDLDEARTAVEAEVAARTERYKNPPAGAPPLIIRADE